MEALQQSIEAYQTQLKQVNDAILASGRGHETDPSQKDDLIQLKEDLDQLISLTKQNLLELKKEQLLKELANFEDSSDTTINKEQSERGTTKDESGQIENTALDVSSLEGVKCQAPFKSVNAASEFYHNAIIFAVNDTTGDETLYQDLLVRVVFSNPTCQKMIPCKYYLDGRCNFSEDQCRHSHGEEVKLAELREFREPNYNALKEGIGILAKDKSSELWKHAKVEGVEHVQEVGMCVHARFSHDNKKIITLPLESVIPLNDSSDDESGSEVEDDDDEDKVVLTLNPQNYTPTVPNLLDKIDGSVSAIGTWEAHTKGIASKLMASMGYIHGTGLGKLSEGRVEPVPIMIYPSGCSIDYCMNIKEKAGESKSSKTSIFSAEKVLEKARKKEEIRNFRKVEKEKNRARREQSFFDLLNFKLVSKDHGETNTASSSSHIPQKGITLSKKGSGSSASKHKVEGKSQDKALKIEGMKTYDEIKRKERQIEKLEQSLKRNKNSGDREILSRKLQQEKNLLNSLKSRETLINREQSRQTNKRKLEIF